MFDEQQQVPWVECCRDDLVAEGHDTFDHSLVHQVSGSPDLDNGLILAVRRLYLSDHQFLHSLLGPGT